jgi:hypothetical protein
MPTLEEMSPEDRNTDAADFAGLKAAEGFEGQDPSAATELKPENSSVVKKHALDETDFKKRRAGDFEKN